jgi:hypothetical protein
MNCFSSSFTQHSDVRSRRTLSKLHKMLPQCDPGCAACNGCVSQTWPQVVDREQGPPPLEFQEQHFSCPRYSQAAAHPAVATAPKKLSAVNSVIRVPTHLAISLNLLDRSVLRHVGAITCTRFYNSVPHSEPRRNEMKTMYATQCQKLNEAVRCRESEIRQSETLVGPNLNVEFSPTAMHAVSLLIRMIVVAVRICVDYSDLT